MRIRTPIILFLILILLVGGIYILSKYQEKKKQEEKRLVKLEEAVQRIEIKRKEGIDLLFEKANGKWRMRKPKDVEADDYVLGRIADEVKDFKYERLVEEKAVNLKKYGLEKPEILLKLMERGSNTPIEIEIGDKNPLNSNRYAKLKNSTKVVIISSIFTDLLTKEPIDYREKKIAKFDETKAVRIEVKGKETSYKLIKRGKDWNLESPVKSLADNYKCDDLLYSITGAEAKEFVSDSANEDKIKQYGLNKPSLEVKITLKGKEKPIILNLSKNKGNVYLLRGSSIYRVEESLYKTLSKKPKELREKRLVRFYSFDVKNFSWKKGKEEFSAKKEGKEWKALRPFKSKLNREKVDGFLRSIEDLEASDYIDNPSGFKPAVILNFTLEKGKKVSVELGEKDGKLIGRERGLGYLLVMKKKLSDIFPENIKDWKAEEKK